MAQMNAVLRQVYLSGSGGIRKEVGQPRVVMAITGGGGSMFAASLAVPGASSCILEMVLPYGKSSCLDFLATNGRKYEGKFGFCSEEMAWELANSSLNRALSLEENLDRWPWVRGLGSTSTIVSHYQRRGGYRTHAACVDAKGQGSVYTHQLVKGARNRAEEDLACASLVARALAESVGVDFDPSCGVRLQDLQAANEVGEVAQGVEDIPTRTVMDFNLRDDSFVVVKGGIAVSAPKAALPENSIVMAPTRSVELVIQRAKTARSRLGLEGDGNMGSWGILPGPLFVIADKETADSTQWTLENENVENHGVLVPAKGRCPLDGAAAMYPSSTFVVPFTEEAYGYLDDGSPSTMHVDGIYTGQISCTGDGGILPHGAGLMTWENGISFDGGWLLGQYHGQGTKSYSKGGGYEGPWHKGKRSGLGISRYDGKWGYDRWEGSFVDDRPHGHGIMYMEDGSKKTFEFDMGVFCSK